MIRQKLLNLLCFLGFHQWEIIPDDIKKDIGLWSEHVYCKNPKCKRTLC